MTRFLVLGKQRSPLTSTVVFVGASQNWVVSFWENLFAYVVEHWLTHFIKVALFCGAIRTFMFCKTFDFTISKHDYSQLAVVLVSDTEASNC